MADEQLIAEIAEIDNKIKNLYFSRRYHYKRIIEYATANKDNLLIINRMLILTALNWTNVNHDIIIFLIEECGATDINMLACHVGVPETLELLVEKYGANNFDEIIKSDWTYHFGPYVHKYLIERGASFDHFDDLKIKTLLDDGCGIILNRDPTKLAYEEAKPFIRRHNEIISTLELYLVKVIIDLTLEYVVYELPIVYRSFL
jgi:hypothetical protein